MEHRSELYKTVYKSDTTKWIINLYNLFKNVNEDSLFISITIANISTLQKFGCIYCPVTSTWIIRIESYQNNKSICTYLSGIDLDDLFKIITNDDSEMIQRIYLKYKIENMM
jgi:hypothetical protein